VKHIALGEKPQAAATLKKNTQGKLNPALRHNVNEAFVKSTTTCAKRNKRGLMMLHMAIAMMAL
jgi:hypothetical protein